MALPIKRWFFLAATGDGKKCHFVAPVPQTADMFIAGWPVAAADDLPPDQAQYRLRVVRFEGDEVVVIATSKGQTGTAKLKLQGALPAYAKWCTSTAKVMLNENSPAESLAIVEATAADPEAVDLSRDDRPAESRLADTTPLPQNKPG